MNINLIIDSPWWFILLCLAAGLTASLILYFRNSANHQLNLLQKRVLAITRFLVVSMISFLLLAPLLQLIVNRQQEPIVLFFQDNSQSLTTGMDQQYLEDSYNLEINEFMDDLSAEYTTGLYGFGEEVRSIDTFNFQDRSTNMADIFSALDVSYSNRNVGAVIIAGDGIFNRGQNPLYARFRDAFPVYTLALGDTIPQKDLIINRLNHNQITYLNNVFPVEITVEAREAMGESSRLTISDGENIVFEESLSFNTDSYFETFTALLEAEEVGIKRYTVEIEPIENEISIDNNTREFFIEVIDSRQQVLILAASPHPDVGAIKFAIDDNENYEAKVSLAEEFEGNLQSYNVIIWHQIPSNANIAKHLLEEASSRTIPQLFILGAKSNIRTFNQLQNGMQIDVRSEGTNDARAETNPSFTMFSVSSHISELAPMLPPLQAPFANYNLSPGTQIFAYQNISNIATDYPLITFSQIGELKTGIIAGEGIWRWRIQNFARNANHQAFDELISRFIQFLSVVEDKSFFRVDTENFLYENEPVIVEAELYNQSYELVNDPDVYLTITNEEGLEFDYVFGRTSNAYRVNAGSFPVGEYQFRAEARLGAQDYEAEGAFSVAPLDIEGINTVANHQLMYQLAANNDGKMFFPAQLDDLLNEIRTRDDIRPVMHSQKEFEDLINLRWIFLIILALLSMEWFIRKYAGTY